MFFEIKCDELDFGTVSHDNESENVFRDCWFLGRRVHGGGVILFR